jgi:hypothetical protein
MQHLKEERSIVFVYSIIVLLFYNLLKRPRMAKIKNGIQRFSGKFGDEVYVDSHRYPRHIRKPVKAGSKRNEAALKMQYKRTAFLNNLASELNTVIRNHSDHFKSVKFYEELQKKFRREPQNKRCLLLLKLKEMEINPRYPMSRLGDSTVTVTGLKKEISVILKVKLHPPRGRHRANCYYYEVLLLCWNKTEKPAAYSRQVSDWIYIKDGKPEFEFLFSRPAGATHWLVCLRLRLGVDEMAIGAFAGEGMQIAEVGSFDKKEQALMNTHHYKYVERYMKNTGRKKEQNLMRVKARKVE